jgi:glycine oxidase
MLPEFESSRQEAQYPSSHPMARSSISSDRPPVSIVGAGIAGTWQALLFAKAGHPVTV